MRKMSLLSTLVAMIFLAGCQATQTNPRTHVETVADRDVTTPIERVIVTGTRPERSEFTESSPLIKPLYPVPDNAFDIQSWADPIITAGQLETKTSSNAP